MLLFGPKKLPELGKTIGKAITEFRRAQTELKSTFDREMRNLERETELNKELTATDYTADSYNYDYSSYDTNYYGELGDSTATTTSTTGTSATEGAGPVAWPNLGLFTFARTRAFQVAKRGAWRELFDCRLNPKS